MEHGGSDLLDETFNENQMVERSRKLGTSGTLAKQNIIWLRYFNLFTVATNQISHVSHYLICIINTKIEWQIGTQTEVIVKFLFHDIILLLVSI